MGTATITRKTPDHQDQMNGRTIMIVDDDPVFTTALAEGIEIMDKGTNVITAENGQQAVAVAGSMQLDLVITDLRMPAMGGLELTLWLNENRPQVPVIIISAYADTDTILDLESQGNYFFHKPIDFADLMRSMRNLLS